MRPFSPYAVRGLAVLCTGLGTAAVCVWGAKALAPGLLPLLRAGDPAALERYLGGFGTGRGALFLVLLQFFQLVCVVLPGLPVHLAAGALFGPAIGGLLCAIGTLTASGVLFSFARMLRRRFPLPQRKKGSRLALLRSGAFPAAGAVLGWLVPSVSKGLLPFAAAGTDLSPGRYLAATALGCAPVLLTHCAVGHCIAAGRYAAALLLCGGLWVLRGLLWKRRRDAAAFFQKHLT